MSGGCFLVIFFLGGGLYLLFEHPAAFWLIAVPVCILAVSAFVKRLKKG